MRSESGSAIVPNMGFKPTWKKLLDRGLEFGCNCMRSLSYRSATKNIAHRMFGKTARIFERSKRAMPLSNFGLNVLFMGRKL
jgi:hypothetical protein